MLAVTWLTASQLGFAATLEWRPERGGRVAALPVPASGRPGFTVLTSEQTGISFTNHLADHSVARNRILENGSGVALGDVDGDGLCDIYFCQLEGRNALYRNLGNWRFEDMTDSAGVGCPNQYSTGAVFADINGDGHLDLLVNALGGGTRAFLNDGKGHFTEIQGSRLVRRFGSTSMALADIDGDGDLDLYVANYRTDTYKDRPPGLNVEASMVEGKVVITPADRFVPLMTRGGGVEAMELGERHFLYLNDGKGGFAPVSWTRGAFVDEDGKPLSDAPKDWGLTVAFRDLDGDGTPDIYVCNDFYGSPDRVWLNRQSSGFRAIPRRALRTMSVSAMSIDFADINRDGYDDIIVVDMLARSHARRQRQKPEMLNPYVPRPLDDPEWRAEVPRNTLFLNRGDGTYAEMAQLSGLAASDWSWGVVFLDVDLDGYEDLLIATGNARDVQDADVLQQLRIIGDRETAEQRMRHFPSLRTGVIAYRNRRDLTFEDVSATWGVNLPNVSQGMALADLDNDGDLDIVINNLNGPPTIFRNDSNAPRIAVRLKGEGANTHGIGAKVRVLGGAVPTQSQEMMCGGRYLSCDDTVRVFAAGGVTNDMQIEVRWRGGKQSFVPHAQANRVYEIDEAAAQPAAPPINPPTAAPLFQDLSAAIDHRHYEEALDDFQRQPLLPRRLSHGGPGVSWIDVDQDGRDDLVIGSGRGGRLIIFKNDGQGGFRAVTNLFEVAVRDQTTILGWPESKTSMTLLVGVSTYEDGSTNTAPVRLHNPVTGAGQDLLPPQAESIGPMALADLTGSGQLELFTGGRVHPGRYPEAVSSRLYKSYNGRFEIDSANTAALDKVGLVSGAVWSDLNGDGLPELVLACEWGPVRVFVNENGRLHEITGSLGLDRYRGWWNGVAVGDFDGDGRLDIVASNWGRNTKYQEVLAQPLHIVYGDFLGAGTLQTLEAFFDPEVAKVVPWLGYEPVSAVLPFVRANASTFRAYGEASVQELLAPVWAKAAELQANTLDSMVFLNRGNHFEAHGLPIEAQFAPAFGVAVADFDGDGREDLFLAQNFFGVDAETSRYDGGRGLLLKGNGDGTFTALPGQASGIEIYGEQRGCAVADYDGDGRMDLVVGQNNGPTRLYHNVQGRPGLRVRLQGPADNPQGIGAVIRLEYGQRLGPAREVHAGSGYWSEDSPVQVLAPRDGVTGVQVSWPGGQKTHTAVGAGQGQLNVQWR